ncbi:hypothetical protein [Pelagibaculum spongiae]|uniref:hypothetical protein n=1 Tax=Pelagibaculum spongiae TaxID=2080658 RepID=UPI0013148446|nr:hypothetical protein [Pelagibaculum spongiae]
MDGWSEYEQMSGAFCRQRHSTSCFHAVVALPDIALLSEWLGLPFRSDHQHIHAFKMRI